MNLTLLYWKETYILDSIYSSSIQLNLVLVLLEMTSDWATRRQMKLNLLI